MPDFAGKAVEFLANSTLQEIWGYHMKGMPADAYTYLINETACEAYIGMGSEYYDWADAATVIATWILPMSGLLLQAPFDSNNIFGTFWAVMRWILWNIRTTANCAAFVDRATARKDLPEEFEEDEKGQKRISEFSSIRDAFFILGVMNQFSLSVKFNGASAEKLIKIALFSKELRLPIVAGTSINEIRRALARDTREARKRGTVQCFLSMLWFVFGMVISIQQSFGLLGQDASAHDLALGLNVIWFPVLVLCTVVDRNPAIPEATQRQLNTYISLVREALMRDAGKYRRRCSEAGSPRQVASSFETALSGSVLKVGPLTSTALSLSTAYSPIEEEKGSENWFESSECNSTDLRWLETIADPDLDNEEFFGRFAGQGRVMFHYGVAHPILQGLKHDGIMDPQRGWLYDAEARVRLISTANPDRKDRLHSFDMREIWQFCMALFAVWGSCMSAFVISYFTPTVGLGCRALGYAVFAVMATGQLLFEVLIWWATPHDTHNTIAYKRWRLFGVYFLRLAELANAAWLLYSIFAQTFGSYNTCKCKCSTYGVGGGYINFNSELDPRPSQAKPYWIAGTATGCSLLTICYAFVAWEWVSQAHLSTEDYEDAMNGLKTTRWFKKYTRYVLPLVA